MRNPNLKISATLTGAERSAKLCTVAGVSVSYDYNTQSLIYYIPSGYTVRDLTDWRLAHSGEVLKAFSRKKIVPSERVLRELHLLTGGKKTVEKGSQK